jgi:hypothetical protein
VATQDGPGQRAIAVLTLAVAPVKRGMPHVRLGPAGETASRPPASRGEGAEGTAFVGPSMRTPARTVTFTRGLPGVLRVMHAASPGILTDMTSEATKKIILGG